MKEHRFLVQINFAEVPELPDPIPRAGLFCVDLIGKSAPAWRWFGVRFYPAPSERLAARPSAPVPCVGKYEAEIRFMPGVSYSPDEWRRSFPIKTTN